MTTYSREADLSLAIGLAQTAGETREWYGLGRREPGPLRLIVIRGRRPEVLGRGRVPAWGAGFTFPAARTIVVMVDAGDPYRILRHELAHLILADALQSRIPLWFSEGYAAVASGEFGRLAALRLNLSVARGKIPDFFELDRALRGNESTAEAAYGLAAAAVAMLARRHPDHTLAPLLARLEDGEPFDEAVLATTGSPLGRFELEWQRDVRRRYGLVSWVMAGGLWFLVALVVIAAMWLRRRRDWPRRQALDQGWIVEEGSEPDTAPLDEPKPGP
ncbi:MAG: peptidase MA family metallohydrolase [Gemmatimonadales bacterium]